MVRLDKKEDSRCKSDVEKINRVIIRGIVLCAMPPRRRICRKALHSTIEGLQNNLSRPVAPKQNGLPRETIRSPAPSP